MVTRALCWTFAIRLAAGVLWLGAGTAQGAESGKFSMLLVATATYEDATIKHLEGKVFAGVLKGIAQVTKSTGDPFPMGMHFDVKCVVYGRTPPEGVDLQTSCTGADIGDPNVLLYLTGRRVGGTVEKGGGGVGTMELIGGTGPFEGITGNCSYDASYLGAKRNVTLMECGWK